jgi:hypothetical protein
MLSDDDIMLDDGTMTLVFISNAKCLFCIHLKMM